MTINPNKHNFALRLALGEVVVSAWRRNEIVLLVTAVVMMGLFNTLLHELSNN